VLAEAVSVSTEGSLLFRQATFVMFPFIGYRIDFNGEPELCALKDCISVGGGLMSLLAFDNTPVCSPNVTSIFLLYAIVRSGHDPCQAIGESGETNNTRGAAWYAEAMLPSQSKFARLQLELRPSR
jgi:hypothetical protein